LILEQDFKRNSKSRTPEGMR